MPQFELDQIEIFHRLPQPLGQTLFDTGEIKDIPAGTIILNEGDRLDCLYIVLERVQKPCCPKTDHAYPRCD